ncbi:MAG: ATP-dependent DNA helicase [Pseudomonadota bacterium]
MTELRVAVRDLAAFCHRQGNLDYRLGASPTGVEGIRGHQAVYRQRPETYQPEYAVACDYRHANLLIQLRGRADGFDLTQGLVEEIKTCRGAFERISPSVSALHWAQLQLYAALLSREQALPRLDLRLTWFNVDTHEQHCEQRECTCEELEAFLEASLQRFSEWMLKLVALRERRDRSVERLQFPHGEFRPGQRDLAELTYKCIDQGGQALLEAPTGIGKTAAVLYPALKALAAGKHDRVVFTTARSTGRRAAEETVALFNAAGLEASTLSLSAKERICFSPGKACHADECPFAVGYYDKLPAAMTEALTLADLSRSRIEVLAREHELCPYHLGIDLLPWMDVVVCDMHYAFSLQPLLAGLAASEERWTVLVDEAHNLPPRARDMYGARLQKQKLMLARREAPGALRSGFDRANRAMLALAREDWSEDDFDCREELPANLMDALRRLAGEISQVLAEEPSTLHSCPAALDFYFDVLGFLRAAEVWGSEFRLQLTRGRGPQGLVMSLVCLDPARLLAARHDAFHASVLFSATLSPEGWIRATAGLSDETVCRRLPSPFAAQQLVVGIDTSIDTRFQQRSASLPNLVATLQAWLSRVSGNTIIYFPSYRYLEDALAVLDKPDLAWIQRAHMADSAREELLTLLRDRRDVLAFCILGGVFGEGVDLPGEQLSNVAVVGVGLPQFNRENEQLRDFYQREHGAGFEFAYLYPGMQKVDQALGRVVRRSDDQGQALLIDQRYGSGQYRALLPPWWEYRENQAVKR